MPGRAPGMQPVLTGRAIHDYAGFSPWEISGRNYPNRTGRFSVFGETPCQIARRQKSARPDSRAPGPGEKLPGRALTARLLFVTFLEGTTTKRSLKHARLPSIVDTKLILPNSFTHDRDQISSVKREGLGRVAHSLPR